MVDYGLVPNQINNLSRTLSGISANRNAQQLQMGELGLQKAQMDNQMMGLKGKQQIDMAKLEREKYLDEEVPLVDIIQGYKGFDDTQKKKMLESLPPDLLGMPTSRRKAAEAYKFAIESQRKDRELSIREQAASAKGGPGVGADPYFTPIMTSTGVVSFNNRAGTAAPISIDGKGPVMPIAADVDLAGNKTAATERAKNDEKKRASLPKIKATYNTLNAQWDMVDDKIDEAMAAVGPFTAGVGSWMAAIPATPQRNLRETLTTIKSNIGFDKLQEMRENSPTGGALGQVSDTENILLQAVQGSLDQGQSPAQLQKNLKLIKKNLARLRAQKEVAFETDFGQFNQPANQQPVQQQGIQPPQVQTESPPMPGAKRAENGKWYVEQNGRFFEVEQE